MLSMAAFACFFHDFGPYPSNLWNVDASFGIHAQLYVENIAVAFFLLLRSWVLRAKTAYWISKGRSDNSHRFCKNIRKSRKDLVSHPAKTNGDYLFQSPVF